MEAKKVLLNVILTRKNLICIYCQHGRPTEHGDQMMRASDETSFVVAYVNCVLKVNANEVFLDQDDEQGMLCY